MNVAPVWQKGELQEPALSRELLPGAVLLEGRLWCWTEYSLLLLTAFLFCPQVFKRASRNSDSSSSKMSSQILAVRGRLWEGGCTSCCCSPQKSQNKFYFTFLKISWYLGAWIILSQLQTLTHSTVSPFCEALVAEWQERQVVLTVVFHRNIC